MGTIKYHKSRAIYRLLFLLLILNASAVSAQQSRLYTIRVRVQYLDTTVYCGCPQDDNTQDYGTEQDCNSLGQVMINIYHDSSLIQTYYTDQTGYTNNFNLPYNNYKLVFHARNYDSAAIRLNFTEPDTKKRIMPLMNNQVHFKNDGNTYFICVVLNSRVKKHGIRIVPVKN
ncbi:MAG: hypothetical protein ACLQQ4_14395 [Bacteroidia bacterium]